MLTGILYTRFWPHFYVGCWLILWPQMKSPNNSYITFWCWFPVMIQFLRKLMSTLILRIQFTQELMIFAHSWNYLQYPVKNDDIFLNTGDICYQKRLFASVFTFVGSKHQIHFYYTFAEGAEIDMGQICIILFAFLLKNTDLIWESWNQKYRNRILKVSFQFKYMDTWAWNIAWNKNILFIKMQFWLRYQR